MEKNNVDFKEVYEQGFEFGSNFKHSQLQYTIYRLSSPIALEDKMNELTEVALNLSNSSKEKVPKAIIDLYSLLNDDKENAELTFQAFLAGLLNGSLQNGKK